MNAPIRPEPVFAYLTVRVFHHVVAVDVQGPDELGETRREVVLICRRESDDESKGS